MAITLERPMTPAESSEHSGPNSTTAASSVPLTGGKRSSTFKANAEQAMRSQPQSDHKDEDEYQTRPSQIPARKETSPHSALPAARETESPPLRTSIVSPAIPASADGGAAKDCTTAVILPKENPAAAVTLVLKEAATFASAVASKNQQEKEKPMTFGAQNPPPTRSSEIPAEEAKRSPPAQGSSKPSPVSQPERHPQHAQEAGNASVEEENKEELGDSTAKALSECNLERSFTHPEDAARPAEENVSGDARQKLGRRGRKKRAKRAAAHEENADRLPEGRRSEASARLITPSFSRRNTRYQQQRAPDALERPNRARLSQRHSTHGAEDENEEEQPASSYFGPRHTVPATVVAAISINRERGLLVDDAPGRKRKGERVKEELRQMVRENEYWEYKFDKYYGKMVDLQRIYDNYLTSLQTVPVGTRRDGRRRRR